MIGWGGPAQPTLTEVHMDSTIAFELTFGTTDQCWSYRSFRYPWHGVASAPYLMIEPADDYLHLLFNKFGDTSVVKYYIYAGLDPAPNTIVDSTVNTYINIYNLPGGRTYYFRVTAVDRNNNESPFSNEVTGDMPASAGMPYLPGDANMQFGIWPPQILGSDVTYLVNYFMEHPSSTGCILNGYFSSADINGDCEVVGSDVTRLVQYFRGLAEISYCPGYPPIWLNPDDLPPGPPQDWPPCEE
jgi:hypothetical protein